MSKEIDFIIDSLGGGGAEKVLIEIANYFIENNYKVRIITLKKLNSPYVNYIDKNIEVNSFNKKNTLNSIFKLFEFYKNNGNKIISFSPAVSCILNIYSMVLGKENNIYSRCLNTLSESRKNKSKSLKQIILGWLLKNIYSKSKVIIAQSEGMEKDLIDNMQVPSDKIVIINNPCNIKKINILKYEKICKKEIKIFKKPTIINVGKLARKKNQEFLLKLLSKTKEKGKIFNLILLGEGKDKEELLKKARSLNIEENVYFLGFKKNPYKYIEKSDFFFLSSIHEGFPNVLLDALACGKIIFSMDCKSGPREILLGNSKKDILVEAKYGYLISLDNNNDLNDEFINNFIQKIENTSKNKKYSIRSKERTKFYSKEKILKKYLNLINKA